jgi:23S rRNA (adenine2503-C2)-methyltransferase
MDEMILNTDGGTPKLIYDLSFIELSALLQSWDEPRYRAQQVWSGIYNQLWENPTQFTNIPQKLKERLQDHFNFKSLIPKEVLYSGDHETSKTLFQHPDNLYTETVLMRYEHRRTLCISTQVGCAMGCVFCATGQMGFSRNLSAGEIIEQVIYFSREMKAGGEKLTNIVIMGMGEPFHNYDNTLKAIDILNDPAGFNFGERRFTISTVGLVPKIRQFAREKRQINLAISLHAADDDLRTKIIPINRRNLLPELIKSCREYFDLTHRRLTFEWALIHNVNDSPEQANRLADMIHGLPSHVNLILLNPTNKYGGKASTQQRAQTFSSILERKNIPCTIRLRRGIDIQAGCGQLAARVESGKK